MYTTANDIRPASIDRLSKLDRPIYLTLPSVFSQFANSEFLTDSAYLVEFFETIYHSWNSQLDSFLDFDGSFDNFTDQQIDALAPFFGFTIPYYDVRWSRESKICLFQGVFKAPYLWRFRGSESVFNYVANCLGVFVRLSRPQGFIAGISKAGDVCGSAPGSTFNVVYPELYYDGSTEYATVLYLVRHFVPLHIHANLTPVLDFS